MEPGETIARTSTFRIRQWIEDVVQKLGQVLESEIHLGKRTEMLWKSGLQGKQDEDVLRAARKRGGYARHECLLLVRNECCCVLRFVDWPSLSPQHLRSQQHGTKASRIRCNCERVGCHCLKLLVNVPKDLTAMART